MGVCRDLPDHGPYPSAIIATRQFHVSLARGAEISVVVPSMGDSISEGSVASLEKKPGPCYPDETLQSLGTLCTGNCVLLTPY